jgi:hypothetical protein
MDDVTDPAISAPAVETVLRQELVQCDAMLDSINPILLHLLSNEDHSLFNDAVLARIRGMLDHLAKQVLEPSARASELDPDKIEPDKIAELAASFIDQPALLRHLHALALEWQLTERMQARQGLDPVLSPLIQTMIASPNGGTAALAMSLLASQARFGQSQRRMELPVTELPGDLFQGVLRAAEALGLADATAASIAMLRQDYDESRNRIGLIRRLITAMEANATNALVLTNGGVALFLSALALAAGLDRDTCVLATNDGQLARLALALRAAGLKPGLVEEQFSALHPEIALPEGFETLGADSAAALLASTEASAGS